MQKKIGTPFGISHTQRSNMPSSSPIAVPTAPPAVKARSARAVITTEQKSALLVFYEQKDTHPSNIESHALAERLGLTQRQVQIWFQNRRARAPRAECEEPLFKPFGVTYSNYYTHPFPPSPTDPSSTTPPSSPQHKAKLAKRERDSDSQHSTSTSPSPERQSMFVTEPPKRRKCEGTQGPRRAGFDWKQPELLFPISAEVLTSQHVLPPMSLSQHVVPSMPLSTLAAVSSMPPAAPKATAPSAEPWARHLAHPAVGPVSVPGPVTAPVAVPGPVTAPIAVSGPVTASCHYPGVHAMLLPMHFTSLTSPPVNRPTAQMLADRLAHGRAIKQQQQQLEQRSLAPPPPPPPPTTSPTVVEQEPQLKAVDALLLIAQGWTSKSP